jgi:hypothetical protein
VSTLNPAAHTSPEEGVTELLLGTKEQFSARMRPPPASTEKNAAGDSIPDVEAAAWLHTLPDGETFSDGKQHKVFGSWDDAWHAFMNHGGELESLFRLSALEAAQLECFRFDDLHTYPSPHGTLVRLADVKCRAWQAERMLSGVWIKPWQERNPLTIKDPFVASICMAAEIEEWRAAFASCAADETKPIAAPAPPDNFGEEVTRLVREIRQPVSMARRDSLVEQLIELIDPTPGQNAGRAGRVSMAATPKHLSEATVRAKAVRHATTSNASGHYTFDSEGIDAFAIDLMDEMRPTSTLIDLGPRIGNEDAGAPPQTTNK